MSEKGNPVISQHDVASSSCLVNNESDIPHDDKFKEPNLVSERKYSASINEKGVNNAIVGGHGDYSETSLSNSVQLPNVKSELESVTNLSNHITFSLGLSLPTPGLSLLSNANKISCSKNEVVEFPTPTSIYAGHTAAAAGTVDIVADLPNVEEWLKARSDSMSSLDFDSDIKPSEIDMSDFLNLKSMSQNVVANGPVTLDNPPSKLSAVTDLVGLYNENLASASGLLLNSYNFYSENDGSLSLPSASSTAAGNNNACGYDASKIKNSFGLNLHKKYENIIQVEKGLFEEMLLTDGIKKNFKLKDAGIGDDKGLFEELLLPGVQEWLLTVSSMEKKDSVLTAVDSISVPHSPSCVPALTIFDRDVEDNKDTFDEYNLIGRNNSSLKLMTPQEIENMPSRSLGFDEAQLKGDGIGEGSAGPGIIEELPFDTEDKDLVDLQSGTNNDVDHKLFNILAMDASNDTLENNHFPENDILDNINQQSLKERSASPENFIFKIDPKIAKAENNSSAEIKSSANKIIDVNLSNVTTIGEKKSELPNLGSSCIKVSKSMGNQKSNIVCIKTAKTALTSKNLVTNVKVITKQVPSSNIVPPETINKAKSLPVGVVQLKLSSAVSQAKQNALVEKKSGIIPPILVKPTPSLNVNNKSTIGSKPIKQVKNIVPIPSTSGIAKVNISVNYKANTTNVSIISSNKEHTLFKINTSDLIRAVSSIKEPYLDPLGLKNQQLMETANAAHKLLSIHSHISHLKKSNQDSSTKYHQNFEINQHIQEIKPPVLRVNNIIPSVNTVGHNDTPVTRKINDSIDNASDILSQNSDINDTIYDLLNKTDKLKTVNNHQPKMKSEEKQTENKKIPNLEKSRVHSENVAISLLPGAPTTMVSVPSLLPGALPTMVSVPSVLDALSGPTTSNVNLAQVLASCELEASDLKEESKDGQDSNSGSDEKTNNALVQLGIDPNTLSPDIGPQGNKRWLCPISACSKHFPKLSYLKVHILSHKGIRPYKCSYENCDWSFYTSYKLKRHLETHLKRRDHVCTEPDCSRRFTTVYNLNTHMILHKRPKAWLCSLSCCEKSFHTRRELEAHMKLHTDATPPYKCSMEGCSKAYFTHNSLSSHMRSHHKEEDLRCQWAGCGKKFDKPCRLKAHMRVHTGQRPYVCNFEGCNWRFQCASKLSRHQRKHTNDRKYSCPICKKAFLRSEHLKGHLLTHTGVRNFQCPIQNCEAKFTAKSSLYVHLKKHKTQKLDVKFHCPIEACDKNYDSKFSLRQHLLKNHTPILTTDSSHLDYITLVSDKELLSEQLLPLSAPSLDLSRGSSNVSAFIPLSLHSASVDAASSTTIDMNSISDRGNASISSDGQNQANILTVHEGMFPLTDGESHQTTAELGFPELSKDIGGRGVGNAFQSRSSARTDVLGNIILSQRAKRRQQMCIARKLAASNELSKANFANDLILSTTVADTLPLSTHFQSSLMQDDSVPSALYQDTLIGQDLLSDPTNDPQSTINLRDLE